MTETKPRYKYRFYTEVTDPETGNTVRVQWDNLTLLEAKKMYRLTADKGSVHFAQAERFGWEEMK
jgi:hypothetical protein